MGSILLLLVGNGLCLDEIEGLEQLRFLENNIRIQVIDASGDPWGIECRADYDAFLQRRSTQAP